MSAKLPRMFDFRTLFDFRQNVNLLKEFSKPNDKPQISKYKLKC